MTEPNNLLHTAIDFMRAQRFAEARRALEALAAAGSATAQSWVLLGQCCAQLGDDPAAQDALNACLKIEPHNIYALSMKGDLFARGGDDRAAASFYNMVLSTVAGQAVPPELQPFVARAEAGAAQARDRFATHLSGMLSQTKGGARFDEAIAILTGHAEPQLQQPTSFFYPGLPQTAFYDPTDFDWVAPLEAATSAICKELEAVLAAGTGFRPYVEADPMRPNKGHALLNNADWSAFHLLEQGAPVPGNADRCPATMAALNGLPLPFIEGRSPMALFSMLRPKTHIPPHWGMLNTRLIVHLPLIIPHGCRLRVGNHIRPVEAGKVMIFDDSINHEAWNDSDETRVVLLFEIWRPELSADERHALTAMFEAIGNYGSA